jgi:AcrR family transcriptional regulator
MSVPRTRIRQPRRQRTYLRADARRAQILDVAKRVFVRRGYHVANVADICKEARIGRGTLYQYFDNKRAVMLALMEELAARVARVLDERPTLGPVPGASKAPIEMIVAFCRKRLREVLDAVFVAEASLRLILRDARGLDGGVDEVIATIDQLVLRAMERDIKIAQELRLIRRGNPRLIARYLLGGVEKMVLTALHNDEPVDLGLIVDMAVDIELFGILHEEVRR